jgi:hypothetical protein
MPADDSLKRLGGGRWETRDGRFAIEPQSGTWVVVDTSQTDELGLPLVRGPFGSLGAAKTAIEAARSSGPAESPLAGRLKEATAPAASTSGGARKSATSRGSAKSSRGDAATTKPEPDAEDKPPPAPEPPPEPRWLRDLRPADRRRARELIERLEQLEIDEPAALGRAEIALDQPVLARLAIERRLRDAIAAARTPADAARAAVEVLTGGSDRELDVRWRLVDDRGRSIGDLDPSRPDARATREHA